MEMLGVPDCQRRGRVKPADTMRAPGPWGMRGNVCCWQGRSRREGDNSGWGREPAGAGPGVAGRAPPAGWSPRRLCAQWCEVVPFRHRGSRQPLTTLLPAVFATTPSPPPPPPPQL